MMAESAEGVLTLQAESDYRPPGRPLYQEFEAVSFFRQFPAGVPGAYRLFANLISPRGGN